MTEQLEREIIALVAMDRIGIPIKSMAGKVDRQKPKLAENIDLSDYKGRFQGNRTYARLEVHEGQKAKGMRAAIDEFSEKYPRHGKILEGMISEQRVTREPTLYFGMNEGCRLTSADYMEVMTNLGFSEARAETMYQELMDASRKISNSRDEERRILVG
jgi:hypothetical protein